MTLVAICLLIPQCMRLSGTFTEIWRLKDNGVTTLTFWGHVTSLVTWPFDSRESTSDGWSIVTMRLSSTVMDMAVWSSSRKIGRSSVGRSFGRSSILHWSHILLFATLGTWRAMSKNTIILHWVNLTFLWLLKLHCVPKKTSPTFSTVTWRRIIGF